MQFNVFNKLDKEWALVSVGSIESNNAMTVSWGSMGILWNKKIITIFIRPTRFTNHLLEMNDNFSLSFFDDDKKEILKFCGKKSGKDIDKAKALNLTPIMLDDALCYEEANLIFTCKKIYTAKLDPNQFLDQGINRNYSPTLQDYHHVYIGEIINVYKR
jgi:flavin reductase (DIM6/NTAB) family NADH-FMN oxidoreductase RutF